VLKRLLQLIAGEGGSLALPDLARRLGVDPALVESMIAELVRLGYLAPVEAGCAEGACRLCPQGGAWCTRPPTRLWTLTEKGRKAVTHPKCGKTLDV